MAARTGRIFISRTHSRCLDNFWLYVPWITSPALIFLFFFFFLFFLPIRVPTYRIFCSFMRSVSHAANAHTHERSCRRTNQQHSLNSQRTFDTIRRIAHRSHASIIEWIPWKSTTGWFKRVKRFALKFVSIAAERRIVSRCTCYTAGNLNGDYSKAAFTPK